MPKSTTPQETGREGERWFISALPTTWLFQPPHEDVGIDGVVVICESGQANGLEFRVQIKASAQFRRKEDRLVIPELKHSAMQYWVTGFTPTLLVAFETSSQTGWCAWANQVLAPIAEAVMTTDGVRSLEMPTRVPVEDGVWDTIRDQLGGLYAAIGRKLVVAQTVAPFLGALEELSSSLKHLYFAEAARPLEGQRTEEQRALMHQLEATAHRDAVRAILALNDELAGAGVPIGGLEEYAAEYSDRCSGFIRGFRELVATDGPVDCHVIAEGFALERRPLMNSIAGVIQQLTQAATRAYRAQASS